MSELEHGASSVRKTSTGSRPQLRTAVDHQRSEFLRRCRARIKPEDVGLRASGRSRTGGLRREDVAALSGVSVSWYTWLEQGRDIRVSDEVLERISQTLRLSDDERTYLFSMVQQRAPRQARATQSEMPEDVERMVQALQVPAVALNPRWDVLSWNVAHSALYRDYNLVPPQERNLLEILLIRPVRHMTALQQEVMARRLISRLRFDYSKHVGDPKFEALFRRLVTHSPLFNRLWRTPDFTLGSYGLHEFTHARFGLIAFEHTSVVPDGHPNIRVVICTPHNVAAKRAVLTVNTELLAVRQAN